MLGTQCPNITGQLGLFRFYAYDGHAGAPFKSSSPVSSAGMARTANALETYLSMDLSASNSIYTNNGTILPRSFSSQWMIKF